MSKVPRVTETATEQSPTKPAETGMIKQDVGSFLPAPSALKNELNAPQTGTFFSTLKMVFPIEIKPGSGFERDMGYKMVLSNGETAQILNAPYLLTVIDARNVTRKEIRTATGKKDRDGKEIEEVTYERGYDRLERGGKVFAKSHATYQQHKQMADAGGKEFQIGNSFVVAIIDGEKTTAVVEFQLFKTQRAYWWTPLMQGMMLQNQAVEVGIADHYENLVDSKAGFAYPSPKKFKQWKSRGLDKTELGLIVDLLKESQDEFMNWLDR